MSESFRYDLTTRAQSLFDAFAPMGLDAPCTKAQLQRCDEIVICEMAKMSSHVSNMDPAAIQAQSLEILKAAEMCGDARAQLPRGYVPILALMCLRRAVDLAYVNATEPGSLASFFRSNVIKHNCRPLPNPTS